LFSSTSCAIHAGHRVHAAEDGTTGVAFESFEPGNQRKTVACIQRAPSGALI
jgi:hypothetical protein